MKINNRVLIKISGEALQGEKTHGIDPVFIKNLATDLKEIRDAGFEIAIVLGGGNIFRGLAGAAGGMDRTAADYVGMMATIMNGVAMQDALESVGCETRLMSALDIPEVGEKYIKRRGARHMEKGRIVICVAGTGNPYFTTDTAGVLRALELDCGLMIKATKVNGVYNKDPLKFSDAVLIKNATYDEVIKNDIKVMDQTGFALAKDSKLKLRIVSLYEKGAILRACKNMGEGTLVS
ncbi:UMP kinase [Candidatus Gracilibacteria bacterium]|nr:UMP kinase [Candidatus Gracilibacteria bacterium]